jgi:hypothetical protein
MGRSPTYVSAMVRRGYVMAFGTKTTLEHALGWLAENPDFRTCQAYRLPTLRRRQGEAKGRSGSAQVVAA